MNTLIIIGGIHSLFFAVFHCMFWSALKWKTQLKLLSPTNRAVMEILNLRLIFVFAFHGIVCLVYSEEMLGSVLGQISILGAALFWLGRSIEEIVYRKLMPEKDFLSILLKVLFVMGTLLYAYLYLATKS